MTQDTIIVNFTNHPSAKWSQGQLEAVAQYGSVVDVPFPQVDPAASAEDVRKMADNCAARIMALRPAAVLCQGEFTLCFNVINRLKKQGVPVFAACSRRIVEEEGDTRITRFSFEGFREY